MQAAVNAATPHHTSARRWVTVRAMKSLMRMNEPSLNTNRRQHANAVANVMLPTRRGVAAATGPPFVPLVDRLLRKMPVRLGPMVRTFRRRREFREPAE